MNIADILDAAADMLSKPGAWGQAELGANCTKGDHCVHTAIAVIEPVGDRQAAYDYFAAFIGGKSSRDIWRWNDHKDRTQLEVIYNLRAAAMKAREEAGAIPELPIIETKVRKLDPAVWGEIEELP